MRYKLIQWHILILLIAISVGSSENECQKDCYKNSTIIRRSKRYLDFIPLSRIFFRANIKDNIIKVNQLWAHAYGFRANFPIENKRRAKRSDVYESMSELINQSRMHPEDSCLMEPKEMKTSAYITTSQCEKTREKVILTVNFKGCTYVMSAEGVMIDDRDRHGFDGRACILKTFCDASKALTPNSGMLFKMFKLIFSNSRTSMDFDSGFNSLPNGDEKLYPYLMSNDCEELDSHCPLSLLHLTPYTDI